MTGNTASGSRGLGSGWRVALWGTAAFLLLLPAVAMQFSKDVTWGPADFLAIGAMLFGACTVFELAARMGNKTYLAAAGVAVVAAFLLIFLNLAVGIIGDEGNPANLMFGGVLGVAIIGAAFGGFQPRGMANAMFGAALAQALVGVIALTGKMGVGGPKWPLDVLALTGFFVTMWLISAGLFRNAARESAPRPNP